MKNLKKGAIEISFAWLFAIIVGACIIFLAIYFASKIISTEDEVLGAEISKEIGILLNPLEMGFQSGTSTSFTIPAQTRIYLKCSTKGNFGEQSIRTSKKRFNQWSDTEVTAKFQNKFIFSEGNYSEGKKFFLFSKPFEYPFKITDLIYLIPSEKVYCFSNAPEDIKNEIIALGQKNIIINCTNNEKETKVCFNSGSNCDIDVNYNSKFVRKGNEKMHFNEDSLMYAAIFSDKDYYECQIKRLMMKTEILTKIYDDKKKLVSQKAGCDTDFNLLSFGNAVKNAQNSESLYSIKNLAEEIKRKNEVAICRLW